MTRSSKVNAGIALAIKNKNYGESTQVKNPVSIVADVERVLNPVTPTESGSVVVSAVVTSPKSPSVSVVTAVTASVLVADVADPLVIFAKAHTTEETNVEEELDIAHT